MRTLIQTHRSAAAHIYSSSPSPGSSLMRIIPGSSNASTSPGSRCGLSSVEISHEIVQLRSRLNGCYFMRLPLELFFYLLFFLTVPALISFESASKAIRTRIEQTRFYSEYANKSQHPLVRRLNEYICSSNTMFGFPGASWDPSLATLRAARFPLVLHYNLNLMLQELQRQLDEGCRIIREDHENTLVERHRIGYEECARRAYKQARELMFLELLSMRLTSVRSNCAFPASALTLNNQGHMRAHALTFRSPGLQDRRNIIRILRALKNRNLGPASAQIRNSLFAVSKSLCRSYHHVHFTPRANTLLHLVCRPDIITAYKIPDGTHLYSDDRPPQFAPALAQANGYQIVDVEDSSDEYDDEGGDYDGPHHHDIVFQDLPWAALPGEISDDDLPPYF